MPDISKINALAIGSVSKVDGLAKASILDIDGVAVPAGSVNVPPLDTYTGAAAAYSVRLLRTAYTGDIMRVRRDSDNVEADIGFDSNNELSLTSPVSNPSSGGPFTDFADFIGHGGTPANGFCRYWYDQSGNSVDAGQATSTSQPKIYDSSSGIIEEGATGKEKPALDFISNSSRSLNGPTFSNNSIMGFVVNREVTNRGTIWGLGGGFMYKTLEVNNWSDKQTLIFKGDGTSFDTIKSTANKDLSQHLITTSRFSNALKSYIDGALEINTTDSYSANSAALGFANRNTQGQLLLQEAIFYETDQDAAGNRTGIETNIDDYYQIPGM